MRILLSLIFCLFCTSHANAFGVIDSAKVIQVRVDQSGLGMIIFEKLVGSQPASCALSSYANAFSFNANTGGGKAILAMALAAKATGANVTAFGTGACGNYGGSHVEDLSYAHML